MILNSEVYKVQGGLELKCDFERNFLRLNKDDSIPPFLQTGSVVGHIDPFNSGLSVHHPP